MKKILLLIGVVFIQAVTASAEPLYRWVDNEGQVHYGDKPATDALKVEAKNFATPVISGEDLLPYATRQAQQNFPVTLHIHESCGEPCMQAAELLKKRGIPYTEKTVKTKADAELLTQASGGSAVPILEVGKKFLSGFEAGRWNGELDVAGYPKTAPYGVRPVVTRAQSAASAVVDVAPTE